MLYVEFVIIKYKIVYGLDFKYFNYKKNKFNFKRCLKIKEQYLDRKKLYIVFQFCQCYLIINSLRY